MNLKKQRPPALNGEDMPGCAVLIFNANRAFIEHYCGMFVPLGFKPVIATTVEAAVAFLRLLVVALVVVDEENGKVESEQVLQHSRNMQYHAPVLVIGGRSNPDFRSQALALGAANYLDHPAFRDDVIHALLPSHAPHKKRTLQHNKNRSRPEEASRDVLSEYE